MLWNFINGITQPFLKLNLPQNEFHEKSLKTEKKHNKFSSQNLVIIDLHIHWISQIQILNTKTKKNCYVNENLTPFLYTLNRGGQENRRKEEFYFFKVYKKGRIKKKWV